MITARNVIAITVTVAVLSIVIAIFSLLQSPNQSKMGRDSFGTRAQGHRAIFEILNELNIPVERNLKPPTEETQQNATIVLWAPNSNLVNLEPAYLQSLRRWIEKGGRIVVAPSKQRSLSLVGGIVTRTSLLEKLGLKNVSVSDLDSSHLANTKNLPPENRQTNDVSIRKNSKNSGDSYSFREAFEDVLSAQAIPTHSVEIRSDGEFEFLQTMVESIEVPQRGLKVLECSSSDAIGKVSFVDDHNEEQTLVALFSVGEGEIVVVSDPSLAHNRNIASKDNSVLIAHLIVTPERTIIFDEFYHGLTIRGNPLWLLTQRTYSLLFVTFLMAIAIWVWRKAIFLGPPLEPQEKTRRSFSEYVEAMSRFLLRSRSSDAFLLTEVRNGTIRAISKELGCPSGRTDIQMVASVLERRDPHRAKQLSDAVAAIDKILLKTKRTPQKETLQSLQRISKCL